MTTPLANSSAARFDILRLLAHRLLPRFSGDSKAALAARTGKRRGDFAVLDRSRPLAFMHIPKSGGTSLSLSLTNALKPQAVVFGFDRVLFGGYRDFASLDKTVRRAVFLSPHDLPCAELIIGHISVSTIRQRYPDAQLITMLREPFSRILSHWLFWRSWSEEELARWGRWANRVRLSQLPLAAFLASPQLACQLDNVTIRMLLWPHRLIPDDNFIDQGHDRMLLTEGLDRLAEFSLVEVVEGIDSSGRLQTWLGMPVVPYHENKTKNIPGRLGERLPEELTSDALDLLALRSRLDLELWRHVAQRHFGSCEAQQLREHTMLRNVARYAALMV